MRTKRTQQLAVAVGVLATITAVLLVGTRIAPGLGLLTLPVSWPGLILLGADETQERYGYWGELILFWLCSLPCIVIYAWLFCCWRERKMTLAEAVSERPLAERVGHLRGQLHREPGESTRWREQIRERNWRR